MSAILILIGISLVVAIGFLVAFFWAVGSGQYEDEYTPSVRMLFEEESPDPDTDTENQSDSSVHFSS